METMSPKDNPYQSYLDAKGGIRGVNEALDALKESQPGTHCLLVYPDLITLRALYSQYTKILLEERNEMVLLLPYYETVDTVRTVLSGRNGYEGYMNNNYNMNRSGSFTYDKIPGIDVNRYEKDGSLTIMDSLKGYFPSEGQNSFDNSNKRGLDFMSFIDILLKQAEKRQKSGLTVLSDLGSFRHHHHYRRQNTGNQKLTEYEKSLPKRYEGMNMKGYCLYHQKDFEGQFNLEQQAELLDNHSRNIMLINAR